jgi:SAM-dependent methyltransferase
VTTADLPFSPAADRNKQPILAALQRRLPPSTHILEIAAGTGQHALHFASAMRGWVWQPTDADPTMPRLIDARCRGLDNVLPAACLDVLQPPWPFPPSTSFGAVYCANMLHISPWPTCRGLMNGAAARLEADGLLLLYGPYRRADVPTAPSNEAFDASLRSQNPRWGLRDLADVTREADDVGLALQEVTAMPAHNLLLVFRAGQR